MLKLSLLIILFAICSSTSIQESKPTIPTTSIATTANSNFNWNALLKCIYGTEPIVQDIKEIVDMIKAKDIQKVIDLLYKTISDGNTLFLKCLKIVPSWEDYVKDHLPFDWNELMKCILDTKTVADDAYALVIAIIQKDYNKATALAYQLALDGSDSIKQCIAVFKKAKLHRKKAMTAIATPIDWNALIKCISDVMPIAQDIKDIVAVIKAKEYKKIIAIVYKIVSDGNKTFLDCVKIVPGWEEYIKEHLPFDWNEFMKCVLDTEVVSEDVYDLVKALIKQDYSQAMMIVMKIAMEGQPLVKQCINVFKRRGRRSNGIFRHVNFPPHHHRQKRDDKEVEQSKK